MAATTTTQAMGSLPSGLGICTTVPDIFYLPELVSRAHRRGDLEGVLSADTLLGHEEATRSNGKMCRSEHQQCSEKGCFPRGKNVQVEEARDDHGTDSQSGSGTFKAHVSLVVIVRHV